MVAMYHERNHNPVAVILPSEDDATRAVADQLLLQFGSGRRLMALCEDLAAKRGGDPLGAVNAAANMLKASAQVAHGFARVARVETRHRSFHEPIQPVSPPGAELNCENRAPRGPSDAELRQQLEDRLQRLADHRDYNAHLDYAASALDLTLYQVSDLVPTPGRLRAETERSGRDDGRDA